MRYLILLFMPLTLLAEPAEDARRVTTGKPIFLTLCSNCHGINGEGNQKFKAPAIAGMPEWFLEAQLKKFKLGHRGALPIDKSTKESAADENASKLMRAVSMSLKDEVIPDIAAYVKSLKPIPTTTKAKGDFNQGKVFFMDGCAACHRYNGHGDQAFKSAPLTILPDWYIRSSLKRFKTGHRGYHQKDVDGEKMRQITESLTEKQIDNLIVYLAYLAKKYPLNAKRR